MSSFAWFFVSWFLVLGVPLLALGLTLALGLALLAVNMIAKLTKKLLSRRKNRVGERYRRANTVRPYGDKREVRI